MFQRGSRGVPSLFEGFRWFSNPFFMGVPVTGHGANIILILGKEQEKQEKEIAGQRRCGWEGGHF